MRWNDQLDGLIHTMISRNGISIIINAINARGINLHYSISAKLNKFQVPARYMDLNRYTDMDLHAFQKIIKNDRETVFIFDGDTHYKDRFLADLCEYGRVIIIARDVPFSMLANRCYMINAGIN